MINLLKALLKPTIDCNMLLYKSDTTGGALYYLNVLSATIYHLYIFLPTTTPTGLSTI